MRHSHPQSPSDVTALLIQAEIDAERIVAVVRVLVALGLMFVFLIVISPQPTVEDPG